MTSQYTVVVDAAPAVDSAWVVTGTITVHNPNGWDIEAEVTDAVGLGGSCLVDGTAATTVTVPANDQATVSYECTFASKPTSYTGRNTAVVTWDAAKAHTASGTAEGYADFAFALTKEIDRSVTVADAQAGATLPVTLDAVTSTLPASFEYGVERVTPAGTCKTYPNTATVTASDGEAHSAGASVTVCVGADLTVKKTAEGSFHRTYKWTVDKTVVGNATKTVGEGTTGMFDYSVTVKPDGYVDSAWELSGTITVTNPNTWEDIDATVADLVNIGGNASCVVDGEGAVTIKAGTSVELPYTCTIPNQPNYSGLNTATATWDGAKYFTPTGTAVGTANVEIALSGTTNETVHVTDSRHDDLGSVTWPNTLTKAYSLTFTGVPGTCTTYPNTATITETQQSDSAEVTLCVGKDVTIAKTAAGTYTTTYPWTVTKKADKTRITTKPDGTATFTYTVVATPGTPVDSAWALTGTITVTNPNDFQPVMVDVTDVAGVGGGAVCTVAGGTGVTLAANETKKLDYSCTFTSQPGYTKSNTATAKVVSGTTASTSVSSTVPAPFSVTREIDKTAAVYDDLAQPGSWVKIGDATGSTPVTFTYPVDHPAATPGTCQAYTNTARVDLELATDPIAKATVEVCTGAPLTVTKTATATYTRTYLWAIAKTTPTPSPAATLNSTLGVPYTVTVTPNGYADSAFTTIGTITVTNPNDWESVTVKSVTDTLDSSLGGTCTVTGLTATNAVLAKSGGSVTLDYSCTYADPPSAYTGTNTATATWDAAAAYTASGSASGTAPVNFALTKEVNKTVSVTDKAVITGTTTTASGLKTLGTATWNATGTPTVFTYTNTYTVPKNGCTSYTNTATITLTGQTASAVVKVCGPPWLGDGTIGFWQNTNGQSIIKKTGVVPGTTTCLLTPWLRTFKPFQDLSATATCTAAATYVYNVIKAANASGASMNAMLKAQMLAAALNYYFTEVDPRRSAPSGSLGDMVFDIRPWSGAFGGATSMTLLQMLQYASGQSNAGGSVWYGQVKATQTLAKDAFAAVNMSRILLAP